MAATLTTLDGTIIPATISGLTVHTWTADSTGLFITTSDLKSEWTGAYATMLAGHADQMTPLQRMEGNAEAVMENTAAARLSATQQSMLRQDLQREYDSIDAAMRIDQTAFGINPAAQFNTYTYLKLEETLQGSPVLAELATQGHGLNSPPSATYDGYTTDFQNRTDGKTFFVGGGLDNGENAVAAFLDDVVLTHAPFAVVEHNGVLEQLNQNGNLEDTLTDVVAAANETTYTRVFVASDFSTNAAAVGAVVGVPNALPAPAVPTPAAPLAGVTALDGSVLPETVSGLTAHVWTADATGLYGTLTDLGSEWRGDYGAMLAGQAGNLTPLQRMEGNAEAVLENTGAAKLNATSQAAFRADLQREFDAIDAAMRIDQATYGIDPTVSFTTYSYLKMEETLQGNETLKELGYQGHGVNSPPLTKYDGFTTDFQNKVDGRTFYVGGGPGTGQLAISAFLDDDVLTHAPFPVVMNNGVLTQLNQNGNLESPLVSDALVAANNTAFGRVYVASDFSTDSTAVGAVVTVPPPTASTYSIAAIDAVQTDPTSGVATFTFAVTRTGSLAGTATVGYTVAGSGANGAPAGLFQNPTGTVAFAAGAASASISVNVAGMPLPMDQAFTATITAPAGAATGVASAGGTVGGNAISTFDATTGQAHAAGVAAYSGPVPGLQWTYLNLTPDNMDINATLPNSFLHSGGGNDAINVSAVGGTNVMDGGTGSNFLVGGTGAGSNDTFYVDDRGPAADIWSTVVNFHAGDAATIFGLTQGGTTNSWVDGQGAAGYTGLTLHATAAGRPTASLSLAGFSTADLNSGRLSATFGAETDGTPYLYVYDKT